MNSYVLLSMLKKCSINYKLLFQKEQESYKTSQEIEEKLISTAFYKLVSCLTIICAQLQLELVYGEVCTP